ncbi:MAG: universal stress protein [Deltaproteobacteria bacterium]|nr:universal stress protein [Deltaproteobacteria bacterium]
MFRHILVPTDLTDRSLKAMEIALKMAGDTSCRVTLLHVIETIEDSDEKEFDEFYRRLRKRALRRMDRMVQLFSDAASGIVTEICFGKRVREIVRYAGVENVDLIVLSSHRIDVENPMQGWGTISYKVSVLSHCPVMLIK